MKTSLLFRLSMLCLILPCLVVLITVCKPPVMHSVRKELNPNPSRFVSNTNELNTLFIRLKNSKNTNEVQWIQSQIWQIWMNSGEAEVDLMMEQGNKAMAAGNYNEAITTFSKITRKMPGYAEGWNKRATAYYLKGNYQASMQDIEQTLFLEKRHFGAISGLASVYLAIGEYKSALSALEKVLELCPYQPGLQEQVHELYQRLGISKA